MEDPVADVTEVILKLTKGSPRTQQTALEQYFVPKASFFHPFCSVHHNRDAILRIFQWYKIMSPHIDISVNSIAYDSTNLTLYINIHQTFRIFFVPFYRAPVTLTTVLQLERGQNLNLNPHSPHTSKNHHSAPYLYYIKSQNDLYQVDQFIRFILPFGGTTLILLWHWIATLCCIVGARLGAPLRWNNQVLADARPAYPDVDAAQGVNGSSSILEIDEKETEGRPSSRGSRESASVPSEDWEARLRQVAEREKTVLDLQERQFLRN